MERSQVLEHSFTDNDFKIITDFDELSQVQPKKNDIVFVKCPCTLIIGQTESGKTMLLNNIIFQVLLDIYKPKDIHIYSSTVLQDKTWLNLLRLMDKENPALLNTNVKTDLDELPKLIKEIQKNSLMDKIEDPILIIIDDMTGNKMLSHFNSELAKFVSKCRHSKVSIIILAHEFKKVSKGIRTQCKQLFLGFCAEDLQPIFKEITGVHSIKALKKMYEKNVINEKENYNFLVIRKDKKPTEGFYRLNFDKILDAYDYY